MKNRRELAVIDEHSSESGDFETKTFKSSGTARSISSNSAIDSLQKIRKQFRGPKMEVVQQNRKFVKETSNKENTFLENLSQKKRVSFKEIIFLE